MPSSFAIDSHVRRSECTSSAGTACVRSCASWRRSAIGPTSPSGRCPGSTSPRRRGRGPSRCPVLPALQDRERRLRQRDRERRHSPPLGFGRCSVSFVEVDVVEPHRPHVLVAKAGVQREHEAVALDRRPHRRDSRRVVGKFSSRMRSRFGRMMSLSTALAGFQLPSLPSSFLLSDRHDAETCAITRFASGAPLSFAGFVPLRFAALLLDLLVELDELRAGQLGESAGRASRRGTCSSRARTSGSTAAS